MAQSESESSSSQDNRDMLSSLPDPVLHIIMSFMPIMQAIQLCVLSKRWKTLWTTLPVLNFGFCELGNNQRNHPTPNRVERLTEFVKKVLLLRETTSQLHTFTLDCGSEYPKDDQTWDVLPSEVFTCQSLEYVTLGHISTRNVINLPSLKQLHLKYSLVDQAFMSKLLNGCPELEDLHVEGGSVKFYELTSDSLKHLKITSHNDQWVVADKSSEMKINAPNLLSFHFEMCSFVMCRFCQRGIMLTMPSLHEACIKFICSDTELVPTLHMTKSNILCGLFHVHHLELNGYWSSVLSLKKDFYDCPVFNNLKCLNLVYWRLDDFDLAPLFLLHSPKLHELILEYKHQRAREFIGKKATQEGPKDAFVQREFLKTVRIVGFGKNNEFVDLLISKLLAHVKIIGDIVIDLSKKKRYCYFSIR